MSSQVKVGALVVSLLFAAATALPADAQHRQRSGSSQSSGARAVPRGGQAGGASAAPRQGQGAPRPSGPQGPGPSAGPRPSQRPGPAGGPHPGPAPGYRPAPHPGNGYRGYYPGYGYRGYYPYGYRGYYPWYGYRSYYPWYGYGWYYPGYYPRFYWGLGFSFGTGYYGPWLYPYDWGYPYYGYDSGYEQGGASLKVEVEPKTAEVYVDGNLAGSVDQYDGMFQSLSVVPGQHEITVYQEGFRSIRQSVYLSPGKTYRVKGRLEPLAPGEPNEPRPQPAYEPTQPATQVQAAPQYPSAEPQGPPPVRQAPEPAPPPAGDSRFGQVAIRVQPGDAEVLIDGEPWRTQAGADRLVVHLAAGTHRVEVRREGYDPFVTAVEIRRGETTVLNVSLARF